MKIEIGNLVSQIKRISDRIFERILSEKKIDAFNGAQGRILYVLWQEEHIPLKNIADRTGLAATTLTSMIDRMEDAGLVSRIPDKSDRRKTLLSLTSKARSLQQTILLSLIRCLPSYMQVFPKRRLHYVNPCSAGFMTI